MKIRALNLSLALAVAAAFSASPALAQQGNGKAKGNGRGERTEVRDRRDDRRRDDDRWRRDELRLERRDGKRVPPGWCIGRGNPHNTRENCGYGARGDRRFDDRVGRTDGRLDRRTSGSYAQRHADFHAAHDRRCRERAAQRPLDVSWQLQVRTECRRIHDDWHRREGIAHR